MNNKFKIIKNIKDSFDFNLDDVASNMFETTRSLFTNFSSAFNIKALAIATMMGLSMGAAADQTPLTVIQETFNQSMKMANSNYNENLPTYFENKNSIKDDIILKNEFWKGSVSTLIIGDINDEIADVKYREQMAVMNDNSSSSIYVSEFARHFLSVKKPLTAEEYYNNVSDYKHYFRNETSTPIMTDMKSRLKPENQAYFEDFITYHEMAHGSFEQENSRINHDTALYLGTEIKLESHSDISSLFMVANKYGLDYKQFKSLTQDILETRSFYAAAGRDFGHNTSVVLSDLLYTLDKNPNIFKNMSNDKISAFSAYLVHEFYNQDPQKLFNHLEKEAIPTSITDFMNGFEEYRNVLKDVQSKNGYILDSPNMGGGPFYSYMVEDVYFTRNPEKYEVYNAAIASGQITKAVGIKVEALQEFMNQDDKGKAIYAVEAHKMMKNMNVDVYANYLSAFYKPSYIGDIHNQSVLGDTFKANKNEVNTLISAEPKQKNKI